MGRHFQSYCHHKNRDALNRHLYQTWCAELSFRAACRSSQSLHRDLSGFVHMRSLNSSVSDKV